jgi:hypothetical protein
MGPLDQALKASVAEGWADVAANAGVELAAVALSRKQTAKARAAMEAVASIVTKDTSPDAIAAWTRLVGNRLHGAPADVLAPFDGATQAYGKLPDRPDADLGAAGPAGPTKLGKAWKDFSGTAPIVTVLRTKDGFEITEGFDREFHATLPASPAAPFADGGVMLAFRGPSVELLRIDLESAPSPPSETPWESPARAAYRLAVGETYSVSKQGVVTIATK